MNYTVTKFVSKSTLLICTLLVVILAIAGMTSGGVQGLLAGFLVGIVGAIPLMLFAEAAHALVTIADNTKKD